MNTIDLHVHSNKSDGSFTPAQLVDYALEKGLSAIALTDHDTTDGLAEAELAAKGKPLTVIPGIEFSTEYEGKDIHILGLFIDYKAPVFQEEIKHFVDSRILRNQKMCARLSSLGMDISYEKLLERFPGAVITRAHYSTYLLENGYIKNRAEAFERYVGDHCSCFVPREKVTPAQAIELILKAKGLPILAHPTLYHMNDERLDKLVHSLKLAGLAGLEAIYSTYTPSEERQMRALAKKYDLSLSGGSDFHGSTKPKLDLGNGYGKLEVPSSILNDLKRKLNKILSPKIFFTDLDGTLLNNQKEITPATSKLLDDLITAGHRIVLNSGRPLNSMIEVKEHLGLRYSGVYLIAYNGGVVYECDTKTILFENRLEMADVDFIMKTAKEMGIYCHTYSTDSIISSSESRELAYYTRAIHLKTVITDDITAALDQAPHKCIAINLESKEHLEPFRKALTKELGERVHFIYSSDKYLEIFPKAASKGNAMYSLCSYLGIPLSDTLAAGDQENDLSMLLAAGTSVAMCNGSSAVKEQADWITQTDNNQDGLVPILKQFFNI